MKKFILMFVVFFLIYSHSDCPYMKANNRPLNIAHRGLSSLLPQNTMQAFQTALFQGADFIQLDVVLTKDLIPLVMHDPFLSRITNIKDFPEFQMRKSIRTYNGFPMNDWWTDQFTLQELRKLAIKQTRGKDRTSLFDFKFGFKTLDEVIKGVIKLNQVHQGRRNPDNRLGGILIEAKDGEMYRKLLNVEIGQKILQILTKNNIQTCEKALKICPIYLQSFDYGTVKYWSRSNSLPRNFLIQENSEIDLTDIKAYADGIGYQDTLVWNYQKNQPSALLQNTRDKDMLVHVWTFQDDVPFFGASSPLQMYLIAHNQLQLDGIITQFSDVLTPISELLRMNRLEVVKQALWHHTEYKKEQQIQQIHYDNP